MGKFFNVQVKPDMPMATQLGSSGGNLIFAAGDVFFDWVAFDIPKGSAKLIDISIMIRGAQTTKEMEFFFAKSINGVAPASIGTGNTAADGTGYYRNVIGAVVMDNTNFKQDLSNLTVGSLGYGASADQHSHLVLTGEPDSGTNVGFDKLYVAATVSQSSGFNLKTGVLADGAVTLGAASNFDVKTVSALNFFQAGDIVHVHDSETAIGTVKSLTATNIVLEAATGVAIADEDVIQTLNPVDIQLCFEK